MRSLGCNLIRKLHQFTSTVLKAQQRLLQDAWRIMAPAAEALELKLDKTGRCGADEQSGDASE